MARTRVGALAVGLSIAVALGLSFVVPFDEAAQVAVANRARLHLRELGVLAGLRDEHGLVVADRPLRVSVVQEGGPLWLHETLADVARRDEAFEPGDGPHVLEAETLPGPDTLAVRVGLLRRGWSLQLPRPMRVRVSPWVGIVGAVLGALSLRWVRRLGPALLLAGIAAQVLCMIVESVRPFGSALAPRRWTEAVSDGIGARWLQAWAETLPDISTSVGAGIVALCVALMLFDHRRSPHRSPAWLLSSLVGLLGAIAWLEASLRTGLDGAVMTMAGTFSLLCTTGVWVAFAWRFARPLALQRGPRGDHAGH